MKKSEFQILLVLIAFLLGILFAIQYKTQANIRAPLITSRIEEVTKMLKEVESEREKLKEEITNLRDTIRVYEEKAIQGKKIEKEIKEKLDELRGIAGFTSLYGQGIIVTLEDNPKQSPNPDNPAVGIVHHHDLLQVINELFAAGAEAIAINNQRIINNSEIRCAGPVILINGERISSPYKIAAIGDKEKMKNSLLMRGGIIDVLSAVGIKATIEEHNEISIPPYVGSISFKYAKIKEK